MSDPISPSVSHPLSSTERTTRSAAPSLSDRQNAHGLRRLYEAGENHAAPLTIDRSVLDHSASGAPAAGHAVRDLFSTDEIFHRLVATADEEFSRSTRLLFLSGLAAGLSIGLSFVACAAITAAISGESAQLVANILYPIGFAAIVLGRYQLYTENTLTPVTLVLTRIASVPLLLRVWGVVLTANVLGAAICAYVLASTGVFTPEAAAVAREFGEHALEVAWVDLFWKGVFAGWLVATMVWLTHAVRSATARLFIVFIIMYIVPSADLFHCIIGAAEVLYLVFQGLADLGTATFDFFVPVVLGNTVGGVLLVAILNYSQTRESRFPDRDCGQLELTWREWLLGQATGLPAPAEQNGQSRTEPDTDGDRSYQLSEGAPVRDEDHILGSPDATITLLHYGDYECPTSRTIYDAVRRVVEYGEDDVRFVWRHLPLSRRHPHAEQAAIATEAAGRQDRYWAMHDRLLHDQDHLTDTALTARAEALGLNMDRFKEDQADAQLQQRVMDDRSLALRDDVRRTSNLFINGVRYTGPFEAAPIAKATLRALDRARDASPAGDGTPAACDIEPATDES